MNHQHRPRTTIPLQWFRNLSKLISTHDVSDKYPLTDATRTRSIHSEKKFDPSVVAVMLL